VEVDGNDVVAVHAAAGLLVAHVRRGSGPRLLHARTYRVKGHVSVDLARYRDTAELEAALRDDPVVRARAAFLAAGGAARQVELLEAEAAAEIAAAVHAADLAPWPDASAAYSEVQTVGAGQWF
jgi:TPP-dependent pyruvate/acetoin dehydrogenase alpha subunit